MNKKAEIKRFIRNNKVLLISLSILILVLGFFAYQQENPNSLHGQIRQAQTLIKNGKLASALNIYNDLVRKYPLDYDSHYQLGNLLLQVQEPDKAKIEFYRAINLGIVNRYEAQIAMAKIYQQEDNYEFAEQLLKSLAKMNNSKIVKIKIGKFYTDWGKKLYYKDRIEALNKYKLAYEYLKTTNSQELIKTKKEIETTYSSIAVALLKDKRENDAIKILQGSINLFDNASARYKLGEIYEYHDINKAIDEYDKAFTLNPNIGNKDYFSNLLESQANALKQKGDTEKANDLYKKAQKYSSKNTDATSLPNQDLIVNIVSTRSYEDIPKDVLMPGVTFKVRNISKKDVKYLKTKIVFWSDNTIHDNVINTLVSDSQILKPDESTKELNIFSEKPIKQINAAHNIKIQIFISQSQPDMWKLYRNTYIASKK